MKRTMGAMVCVLGLAACGGRSLGEPIDGTTTSLATAGGTSTFNVAFGEARPSQKTGAAAVGEAGDFWNSVAVGFSDDHTETGLLDTSRNPTSIAARLENLGGAWGQAGKLALHDPMIESYDYPTDNRGGDARVTLSDVPGGIYTLLVYGTSSNPDYYGDYSVTADGIDYGRKTTTSGSEAAAATTWVEGLHYVTFRDVHVGPGGEIEILIQPGGLVSDGSRTFRDAYICGLQLVRER